MDKVYVVYWSQTGNTETMAQAVGKGAEAAGKEASVVAVSDITADVLKDLPGFALGCPATVVDGEGVIANEAPDEEALSKCEELGKKLAAL